MSLSSLRWRISDAVRRVMLNTHDGHPLRRAYQTARRFAPVRWAWRLVSGDNDAWRNVEKYEKNGGVFAALLDNDAHIDAIAADFGSADYFTMLIKYARAGAPKYASQERKVLIVNNGLAAGGAERQIVYTAKDLKERGFEPVVIGEYINQAPGLDFYAETLMAAGLQAKGLAREAQPGAFLYKNVSKPVAGLLSRAPSKMMLEILDMVALIKSQAPSVIHLWQDETSIKHGLAAIIAGVPRIILSGRNMNPTHFGYFLPFMREAYLALLAAPGVVLSNNSVAGAASYARWLDIDEAAISVIENGIDTDSWPAPNPSSCRGLRKSYRLGHAQPVITGIFRLSQEKQPFVWLEAAACVRRRLPDAAFLVLGDGPMKGDFLEKKRALGLDEAVIYVGETKNVHDYLAVSDMFLLASAQEGTPNVLLEAQWRGLACVTTDAGGAGEAIEDGVTGTVVPLTASPLPEALASALVAIWNDETFRRGARISGPALIEERFSIEVMIHKTLSLYGFLR